MLFIIGRKERMSGRKGLVITHPTRDSPHADRRVHELNIKNKYL